MAGNNDPLYSKVPYNGSPVAITAANTSSQGGGTIGTDIFLAFTADATNGSFVRDVSLMPTASAAGTATTATVARVFLSTKTSGATASTDTHLLAEATLASQTADSTSAAVSPVVIPINRGLAPGETILITNHAAPAANTSWKAIVTGGKY